MTPPTELTLPQLREAAEALLEGAPEGAALDRATAALVAFAVRISVTTLDAEGAAVHAARALEAGLTAAQLQEAVFLVSGLGTHSLFEGLAVVESLGGGAPATPRDPADQARWARHIGQDRYWHTFEAELPGVMDTLLRASPAGFEAFFQYCAVPWQSALLPALSKELVALAVDATPTHRYLPGLRLHLRNALKLGAGRAAVREVLDLAAEAPAHRGVGRRGHP